MGAGLRINRARTPDICSAKKKTRLDRDLTKGNKAIECCIPINEAYHLIDTLSAYNWMEQYYLLHTFQLFMAYITNLISQY